MSNGNGTGFPWLNSSATWDPTIESNPVPLFNPDFGGYTPGGGAELGTYIGGTYVPPPASGANWSNILGSVSGFINATFPDVWATITGKPVVVGDTAQQQAAGGISTQIPQLLLVAGVAVLGVALALALFRAHPAK